ncbi:hypothetical protein AU197_14470 [Mycobacterium sp. IS-1590]|uniref:hypothetical protein n=1 Tax=Mycobacterium sp. IS-1590 TaxID=1772286 RepID=UPI00074808A9|nr:hypothetical protein [Mycobacterium sp. IS-1590]KUI42315.1 hypothetical protein AU197_14470 [Mycobacterium sp. IS-1590]
MLHHQDPYDAHTGAVDTLAAAGVEPPETWAQVQNNFLNYTMLQAPTLTTLSNAIIDGTDESTIAGLRAQALAEATALPPAEAQVTASVRAAVLARLRDIYAPHAQPNYQQLAESFTNTATKLAAAMRVIDPDTEPDQIVTADSKCRTAWSDAQQLAAQLNATLPALVAAATLAGIRANTDEVLIPLTADTSGLHRRQVWEAWNTTDGRTGRWGALIRLGATIRAADLDNITAYRKAKPLEERHQEVGRGQWRRTVIDPEDSESSEAQPIS